MVKKLTSEEFCSVAHRKAYHDEQEQLALARLIEDQTRRKPARKPLNRPQVNETSPDFAEYLHQQIEPKNLPERPRSGSLELHFQPVTISPAVGGQLAIPRGGLAAPELNAEIVSPFGLASVEDALAALSQKQPLAHETPNSITIFTGVTPRQLEWDELEIEIPPCMDPIEPLPPLFECKPAAIVSEFALPASNLQPWQHLPTEVMDFTRAAGAQLPFNLAARFRPITLAALPAQSRSAQSFTIPWQFQPGCNLATNSGLAHCESADEFTGEWLASVPKFQIRLVSTSPVAPSVGAPKLAFGDPRKWIETILGHGCEVETDTEASPSAAPLPNPPEVRSWDSCSHDTQPVVPGSAVEATAPDMVSFAGSIPRLFSRPRPSLPRDPELSAAAEIPQGTPNALLMAQSRSARTIIDRTANKCEPFEEQFSHPDSFLKSIQGSWAATDSLFAFNDPIPPKARIASVRRSTLSVVAKTYRGSRPYSHR